jgi:hypothetical protein
VVSQDPRIFSPREFLGAIDDIANWTDIFDLMFDLERPERF